MREDVIPQRSVQLPEAIQAVPLVLCLELAHKGPRLAAVAAAAVLAVAARRCGRARLDGLAWLDCLQAAVELVLVRIDRSVVLCDRPPVDSKRGLAHHRPSSTSTITLTTLTTLNTTFRLPPSDGWLRDQPRHAHHRAAATYLLSGFLTTALLLVLLLPAKINLLVVVTKILGRRPRGWRLHTQREGKV